MGIIDYQLKERTEGETQESLFQEGIFKNRVNEPLLRIRIIVTDRRWTVAG
jgi:hypothetical protein